MWLVGEDPAARGSAPVSTATVPGPDLAVYRSAVTDLVTEISGQARSGGARLVERIRAERILVRRLTEPEFTPVLAAAPGGCCGSTKRLLTEVRNYQPSIRSSAPNLTGQIKVWLLAQIDAMWWGEVLAYQTDEQLLSAPELTDLDAARRRGTLRFRYRRQATTLVTRAVRAAERRAWPSRTPCTAGLRFARVRPEVAAMLGQLATEFAALTPPGSPPLWVTSLARSVQHQHHLRRLGYAAALPSAHCTGYAADVEITWFRRFGTDEVLRGLLLDLQRAGDVSVIDEGQAWHVCVSPGSSPGGGRGLRRVPEPRSGG